MFSDPQIIRLTYSRAQVIYYPFLATRNFRLKVSFWVHRPIRPQIIRPTLNFGLKTSPFGTSNFQTPNNLAHPKFQTPNKRNSTSFPKSRSYPSPRLFSHVCTAVIQDQDRGWRQIMTSTYNLLTLSWRGGGWYSPFKMLLTTVLNLE